MRTAIRHGRGLAAPATQPVTSQEEESRVEQFIEAGFATVSRNPSDFETAQAFREAVRLALAAAPTPPANDTRLKRITSAEWDAATAAATRGISGGWQRGSDFVHVVAAALGMSGGSAMASANAAPSAPSDDFREAYRVGFNDGADGDFNPDGFMVRYHAAPTRAQVGSVAGPQDKKVTAQARANAVAGEGRFGATDPVAHKLREALRTELERQCAIGAGTFTVDDGFAQSGLWQVSADLDSGSLITALVQARN